MNQKRFYLGIGLAVVCLWALAMAAAGRQATSRHQEAPGAIRIGVSLYRGDDTFINNLRTVMEEKAKAFERETGIKVTMDIMDAKESQIVQNGQVERFISVGCDVICINPVDRSDASTIIDKAVEAGVPVVFFNREPVEEDMGRWEDLYYVGADAKESAVLQGNIVADAYKKTPELIDRNQDGVVRYVLLEGEFSHQDSLIRTEWSIQTLKNQGVLLEKAAGGIANWERSQASALMEQWMETYPGQIELVISNNDDMALGAIDAIDRAQAKGIQVVGIDGTVQGLKAIQDGKLLGTVESDKELYAGAILQIAVDRALGRPLDGSLNLEQGKYYRCPQYAVTQEIVLNGAP